MSSESDDYDANSVNNTSERSRPKKRKRNSTNEDRANASMLDSSDLHGFGHQVLLSLYNYNGKFQTSLHSNELRDAFHKIHDIFGFELAQTDNSKRSRTYFVRNILSDPTWCRDRVINTMTKLDSNKFHIPIINDTQLSQIGKFSLIIMILYREGVDTNYSMDKKDLSNYVKTMLDGKEFSEVIKEMIRLEYITATDDKYSLGGKSKDPRDLTPEEKDNEKEPRFTREISLDALVMKCNEIDAAI